MRRRSIILGRGPRFLYEATEGPGAPAPPQPPAPTPGDGGDPTPPTQPGQTPAEVNAARAAQRKAEKALADMTAAQEKAERDRMTEADRARAEKADAERERDALKTELRRTKASQVFDRVATAAGITGDRLAAVSKLADLDKVDPDTPDSAVAELAAVKASYPSLFEGVTAGGGNGQPAAFGAPAGGTDGQPDPNKGDDAAVQEGKFLAGLFAGRRAS